MAQRIHHVVITGASSGIGEALAKLYAKKGCSLALTGRNQERLEAVAEACRSLGSVQVHASVIDVCDQEKMRVWLEEIEADHPVDMVIANAGIGAGTGERIGGETPEQIEQVMAVNWQGVMNTINPLLPKMVERGRGHIALMSSLAGYRGWPGAPSYCASKAAVKVYGEGLRGSLFKTGVKVHVICPGFVKSRMTDANDFPMPFKISAERAAEIIGAGIENDRGRIAFPWQTAWLAWLFGALPDALTQRLLRKMPSKKEA